MGHSVDGNLVFENNCKRCVWESFEQKTNLDDQYKYVCSVGTKYQTTLPCLSVDSSDMFGRIRALPQTGIFLPGGTLPT